VDKCDDDTASSCGRTEIDDNGALVWTWKLAYTAIADVQQTTAVQKFLRCFRRFDFVGIY